MAKRNKPYIVGICGGSGSGKSFFLNQLKAQVQTSSITFISLDNYYFSMESLPKEEGDLTNFDHPEAFRWSDLIRDMEDLINGKDVMIKEYTFMRPDPVPEIIHYTYNPLIVIEGIHVFYNEKLRGWMDLKVFIDAEEHLKLSRRLIRDYEERGYTQQEILRDYRLFVMPMYKKYVEPLKTECDLIIPNNQDVNNAIEVLKNHLDVVLNRGKSNRF